MKSQTFVIKSHDQITSVIAYLHSNYTKANFENKPLVVRVNQQASSRSIDQNRLMWFWLGHLEKKLGQNKDDLHFLFKKKFLSRMFVENYSDTAQKYEAIRSYKAVISQLSGDDQQRHKAQYEALVDMFVRDHISTTRCTTKEFTEYLNQIEAYSLGKLGVALPVPEDLKWCYDQSLY